MVSAVTRGAQKPNERSNNNNNKMKREKKNTQHKNQSRYSLIYAFHILLQAKQVNIMLNACKRELVNEKINL